MNSAFHVCWLPGSFGIIVSNLRWNEGGALHVTRGTERHRGQAAAVVSVHWLQSTTTERQRLLAQITNIYSSQCQRVASPRSRCQQLGCLVMAEFLVCMGPSSPCMYTSWEGRWDKERERKRENFFSIKALIPFMVVPSVWPMYLPKAPPSGTITLRIRLQHLHCARTDTFSQ